MKRHLLKLVCAAIILSWAAAIAAADVKIKTKNTTGAMSTQSTTWIKGTRVRSSQGIGLDTIEQCDLNRTVVLNDKAKRYMVQSKPGPSAADSSAQKVDSEQTTPPAKPEKGRQAGKKGVTTYTTTVVDTGERKEVFGFAARHLKLTIVAESTPEACNPVKIKMETDGWYIDLDVDSSCQHVSSPEQRAQSAKSDCGDEVRYKTIGDAKIGFPVKQTTTAAGQDGRPQVATIEVLELSQQPLDAKLFDVPADYKEASNYPEVAGLNMTSLNAGTDPSSLLEQLGIDATTSSSATAGSIAGPVTIEPKSQGTIRIGVATPENKSDRKFLSYGLREKLMSAVGGGNVETIPLRAHAEADAEAEAQKNACDYVLFTDIATLKKSTGGGMFGKVSKMTTGANPLNDKYEAKVDYRLYAAGNSSPLIASSESAKGGGGVNVIGVIQTGMTFSTMFMPMGMPMMFSHMPGMPGIPGMPGMGTGMVMQPLMEQLMMQMTQQFMSGAMQHMVNGANQGFGQPLDKKEEATLGSAFTQEAKAVVAAVQKRQQ